ncbi:MAG TPA: PASTA domain-containing protein, partial [Acidimicrobiales bacterium]
YAVMRQDSLYFVAKGPGSSNGSWKTVATQSPATGTLVAWHGTVHLTTSLRTYRGPRVVPRLGGLSRTQVYAAMKKAQLYFDTKGPGSANGTWIAVVRQSPAAGTRVRWHSVVLVTTSLTRPKAKVKTVVATVAKVVAKPKPKPKPAAPTSTTTTTTTATTTTSTTTTTTYLGETTTSTSTTTVPVTTTTAKKVAARYRTGLATWYKYFPGRCASWYLPMGTHIIVRDLATGRSVRCVVTDREGARGNRAVDLNAKQFAELAPLSRGVISVEVSW